MTRTLYSTLFELIRLYNLKGKFAGGVYDTALSPLEAYVVVEVAAQDGLSINEIVEILGVNRSAVSRAISRLCRNKYILAKNSNADRRIKRLSLLERGRAFLVIHDAFNEQYTQYLSKGLSSEELHDLARYLDLLAANDGALPVRLRPHESELLRGLRRIARVWDILTGSFLQTGYSVLHWQILTEVSLMKDGLRPLSLVHMLNLPKSTLSQILSRFRADNLIEQKRTKADLRGFNIHLARAGRKALRQIQVTGARRIKNAISKLPVSEQRRFVALMERFVIKEGTNKTFTLEMKF